VAEERTSFPPETADPVEQRAQPVDARGGKHSPSISSAEGFFSGGLDAYLTVTDDDYRSLFDSGMIVLDTNTLLNLYRYHASTREVLIEVLARLKDRLWVPHQVIREFLDRRSTAIASRSEEAGQSISDLNKNLMELEKAIRTWMRRFGFPQAEVEQLLSPIATAVDQVANKILEQSDDDLFKGAEDAARDPVIASLKLILNHAVGDPLPADEMRIAKKEAQQRIADKRPPGWKDANKRDNAEGDYLIWYQTLQKSKETGADVLFVTGDVKPDWWRMERGESKGPLPELAHEMRATAGARLFMLRPESFLLHASKILGIKISSESVQEVQRVTVQAASSWNVSASDAQVRGGVERLVRGMSQLERWHEGAATYELLRSPVLDLLEAASKNDPKRLLAAVWSVIKAAENGRGLFGGVSSGGRPSSWEEEVWSALDFIYINAVQEWLENAADLHMSHNPDGSFIPDSLPPHVVNVESREFHPMSDSCRIEFTAFISDRRQVVVRRPFPPGHGESLVLAPARAIQHGKKRSTTVTVGQRTAPAQPLCGLVQYAFQAADAVPAA
jgi:hypothetical protein